MRFMRRAVAHFCAGMTTRCPIRLCLKNAPDLSTQRILLQTREEGLAPYFRCDTHLLDSDV
jgi:hypothetical protein